MSEAIVIKDPEKLNIAARTLIEKIQEAKTTYQYRKAKIEEELVNIKNSIDFFKKKISELYDEITKINEAIEYKKKELQDAKNISARIQSQISEEQNNRMREHLAEIKVQQISKEIIELNTNKDILENKNKYLNEKKSELEKKYNDINALYIWLIGSGARELERLCGELNKEAETLTIMYEKIKSRNSMGK